MANPILYEQPLNERIRTFLRLEHFFARTDHFLLGNAASDTEAGVNTLVDILSILERNDIRGEILKELERHIFGLSKLLDTPGVDRACLDATLEKLTAKSKLIQNGPSRFVLELKENELLNSIRQRTVISAGTCGFDLPAYHYLLNQPTRSRNGRLEEWLKELCPLKEGIQLLLSMIRKSALFERQNAEDGFFQKSLDTQNPCQLIRILLPEDLEIYPEVSGSKHRVNVRLLKFSETGRPKQIDFPQEFEISCCSI